MSKNVRKSTKTATPAAKSSTTSNNSDELMRNVLTTLHILVDRMDMQQAPKFVPECSPSYDYKCNCGPEEACQECPKADTRNDVALSTIQCALKVLCERMDELETMVEESLDHIQEQIDEHGEALTKAEEFMELPCSNFEQEIIDLTDRVDELDNKINDFETGLENGRFSEYEDVATTLRNIAEKISDAADEHEEHHI